MTVLTEPLPDADLVVVKTGRYEGFGGVSVSVRGGGRDLVFPSQTVAQLLVGTAGMLLQGVPAACFIDGQVASGARGVRAGLRLRLGWFRRVAA